MNAHDPHHSSENPAQSPASGGWLASLRQRWQRLWEEERLQNDVEFMDEVDAALHRKPRIGPCLLTLGTAVLIAVLILWAAWAEVDEVANGQGQVIPSQRTQDIEHLEGGILEEVLVSEGDMVNKDDALARIYNEASASQYRDALGKSLEQRVGIARLEAVLADREPVFDAELQARAPQIIRDQMQIHTARDRQYRAELDMLDFQHQQKEQDVQEQKKRLEQVESNLRLSREQLHIADGLMKRQLYSRVDFINLQQKVVSLEGDQAALQSSIPKAQAAAEEALQKYQFRLAELRGMAAEELNKRRTELASLQETMVAGSDRVARTTLRSPVRGIVKQIRQNTLGGVVKPGVPIMDVVPIDDSLLVEVHVRPADIAFIHQGQKAMIKISAYDFSIYGGLPGKVEQISADTLEDKRGDLYYRVKVRTQENAITYKGEHLPIIPGMICTADILTGKKTVLDFLLKPILKAKQNALRER